MSKRLLRVVLLAAPLVADFDQTGWRFRKALSVRPAMAVVRVDRNVYAGARTDLADLRVVRGSEEIPYVLEKLEGARVERDLRIDVLDQSAIREGVQVTLEVAGQGKHNRLRLATARKNFRQKVQIETSDARKLWAMARQDGWIFDFSQGDRQLSSLTVEYPVSTRRYLRVTVFGWNDVQAVTGAWINYHAERAAARETLATATPLVSQDAKTQSTLLVLDVGVAGLPADRVRIETTSPWFHRAAVVETSEDNHAWSFAGQGVLARMPGEETSAIQISERQARYYRVRIYNGDDKPLTVIRVSLEGLIRQVKFDAGAPGQYWLYYGNPGARRPTYDLPALLARREDALEGAVQAGPEQVNPAYKPPPKPSAPWSEQHPAILYALLIGAVIGIGVPTLRFLSKIKQTGTRLL